MVAAVVAIGVSVRRSDTFSAGTLVFVAVACAILFAWSWRKSLFAPFEWAKRYVEGVEGDHRHEWYAFRGYRVRVVMDANRQPWFVLDDIAPILALVADKETFRRYGPHEIGTPEPGGEKCLSEGGLRRLIKYSDHRDAGAVGLWLEREVMRILRNRSGRKGA